MSEISSTSELTTKEIVEQAISDLYKEYIFPFLNGQVPTIANKFSKSDLMSYDEQIVGCTPDGKPLYQKIVECGALPNMSSKSVAHGISDADLVFIEKAFAVFPNGNQTMPIPCGQDETGKGVQLYVDRTNILIYCRAMNYSVYTHTYITLQYNKTTDEAIAIGSDTDYSLEEKIVGTDVDGTPIYQKSFTGLSVQLIADSWTDIVNISSLNIDKLKGVEVNSGDKVFFGGANAQITNNNIQIFCMGVGTITVTELTLKYTKTS